MWRDIVRQAITSLARRPARSALTILGLMIGVASFIAMVAFSEGARRSVMAQFESLGTHAVVIRSRFGSTGATGRPAAPLVDEDAALLRKEVQGLLFVAPHVRKMIDVRTDNLTRRTQVMGTTADFFKLRDWKPTVGGVLQPGDETLRSKVCVLGASTARLFFSDFGQEALGGSLRLGDRLYCSVIGVLETKGTSTSGGDQDELILVPVRTYTSAFGFPEGYNNIDIKPAPEVTVAETRVTAEAVMRRAHHLNPDDSNDFAVSSPDDVIKVAEQTSMLLGRLLAGVALVSLLVGGIGIMNILLVSVGERTQEIGIRSAIGAPPRAIMLQFLAEALALSILGAALGASLGGGAALLVAGRMGWAQSVSLELIAMGIGFGVAVGLVFGILPARRASTLDPIVALRRE